MTLPEYLKEVNLLYKSGSATEHSYRGYVTQLIESLVSNINVTNEPRRSACGAPDYIITRKNIPIGFIEAKDVGADLFNKTYKEQFDRYKSSLNNLIITDYLNFQFFIDGVLSTTISIGHIENGRVVSEPGNFDVFTRRITEFCSYTGQTITSSLKLAKLMAAKARLLSDVIELALTGEQGDATGNLFEEANNTLRDQFESFKTVLIHDITHESFADMYAQTIAYGMFAARLNDSSLDTFTRQEAADLVPKTNPFLRRLFQYVAGYDLDDRIKWIVDALADVFRATNVAELMKDFGKAELKQDPIIHFYETFLSEYDPSLRKSRGVWYTPQPVVNFIVRAVDDILKDEFGLPQGLADTSKVKIKVNVLGKMVEREVHRVQFLDPATGTATFIAEIISQVHKKFEGQQGLWSNYVEEHLIPRLNGFEILMASYAMAHLKLELLLKETGYQPIKEQRFRIYLTNSLEEHHPDTGNLFGAAWLSYEANEANLIKRDTPVMVVLGNPPYSIVSSNLSKAQRDLIEQYKYVDDERIKEKGALQFEKILNDDYIKFISLAEKFVLKNSNGIVAFINNHNFLDSPQLRGLRWHLAKTFDKVYIIDLHGNSKKKEVCPDGSPDFNVFDIQQGVSINIFVKKGYNSEKELAKVFHTDCFGTREKKYNYLLENNISTITFTEVNLARENYFFVPFDRNLEQEFKSHIDLRVLFKNFSTGIISARDNMVIDHSPEPIINRVRFYKESLLGNQALCDTLKISLKKGWDIDKSRKRIKSINNLSSIVRPINYRPFDFRHIFYDESLVWTTAQKIMSSFLQKNNLGLIVGNKGQVVGSMQWNLAFITSDLTDFNMFYRGGINMMPLYVSDLGDENQQLNLNQRHCLNLNKNIIEKISTILKLSFIDDEADSPGAFTPIDLLDYIYAILHSPTYREKYKEFLKIDFPRIPYPKDPDTFWQLVKLGGELRQLHLMESPILNNLMTQYPIGGSNQVEKVIYEDGKVNINKDQYFANVPQLAWEFYIGGYQPAQKWLKDRKGRVLLFDDILHYQRIIVALSETERIMREIDRISF